MPGIITSSATEVVAVRVGVQASVVEVYVASGGGAIIYTELVQVKAGARSAQADVLESDPTTEIVTVRIARTVSLYPVGTDVWTEAPTVRAAARSIALEGGIWSETQLARFGARGGQTDVYTPNAFDHTYYELATSRAGGRAGLADVSVTVDLTGSRAGRRLAAGVQQIIDDSPIINAGSKALAPDLRIYANDTVSARVGGRTADAGKIVHVELPLARPGAGAAAGIQQLASDSPNARAGARVATVAEEQDFEDTPVTRLGSRLAAIIVASLASAVTARVGDTPAALAAHVGVDAVSVRVAASSSLVEGRSYLDLLSVRRGGRSGVIDALVVAESVRCRAGGRSIAVDPLTTGSGLIPAIRANAAKALPELTQIPEGLPDEDLVRTLRPPFLVIFAHEPSQLEGAVNDVEELVDVDLIYVREAAADGQTDVPQIMRGHLHLVSAELLRDYMQFGSSGIPSAIDTHRMSTPMERANTYRQHFLTSGRKLEVMVLTMQFVLSESLVLA